MRTGYFAPDFRVALAARIATRHGLDAWTHLMRVYASHEMTDCRWVRHSRLLRTRPYDIQQAIMIAASGQNTDRPYSKEATP